MSIISTADVRNNLKWFEWQIYLTLRVPNQCVWIGPPYIHGGMFGKHADFVNDTK